MIIIETGFIEKLERKQTNNGTKYIRITLNAGKVNEKQQFDNKYDVDVFNMSTIQMLEKTNAGTVITVTGRPNISAYLNSKNEPTYKVRINANDISFLNTNIKSHQSSANNSGGNNWENDFN